jgi:hypothetical protein
VLCGEGFTGVNICEKYQIVHFYYVQLILHLLCLNKMFLQSHLRQEDYLLELKSFRPAWATWQDFFSKKKK